MREKPNIKQQKKNANQSGTRENEMKTVKKRQS